MGDERLRRARDFLRCAVETLDSESSSGSPSSGKAEESVGTPRLRSAAGAGPSTSCTRSARVTSLMAERNRLFNFGGCKGKGPKTKKKRLSRIWTHDFICLSKTTDNKAPSSFEAGELYRAGLGKRQLSFMENGDSNEIHDEIMETFPKLKEGGGYELLRVNDVGGQRRELLLIPPLAEGYTVNYLKEVIRQAKVYIRPVQRDLNLESSGTSRSVYLVRTFIYNQCCNLITVISSNLCQSQFQ